LSPGSLGSPINCDFPEFLEPIFQPKRYKIMYGGRGGGRSWGCARALLLQGMQRPLRVLCTREFQSSIKDSVHRLLETQIDRMGIQAYYNVTQHEIQGSNGTAFLFEGLRHNITKIKSLEGINICWCEEAERISNESWRVLIPTIREDASEIWVTFNPYLEEDPTYQRFIVHPPAPDQIWAVKSGWKDNKWFPDVLKKEKEHDYRVDAQMAEHVWGGECLSNTDAQILGGKWIIDDFRPGRDWQGPYHGADWGFAHSPTAAVKLWIYQDKLYVERESVHVKLELVDTPGQFLRDIPGSDTYCMRSDSARPETISYMQRHDFPMVEAAKKWKGSVEDGIAFLRSFEQIIIHTRCRSTALDARLYSYKIDQLSGDILPDIVKAHDDTIDAVRYALAPMITAASKLVFPEYY